MISSPLSEPVDLSGQRVFVTGGTGFVGRCLLDYFLESAQAHRAGFEVSVLTRSPQAFLTRYPKYAGHSWLRFEEGSLDCLPAPVSGRFTSVLHAAAQTHTDIPPLSWLDQLVQGTRHALEFAVASGAERFLLVSSGAAYGAMPEDLARLREDAPFAPVTLDVKSVYGQGKRMAEHLCALYGQQFGLACVIARCFALISEHMPMNGPYAAGNFVRDALAGKDIEVQGDGRAVRTYLYGRDAAHWLTRLMCDGQPGQIYNVGSDAAVSILELAQAVAAQVSPPVDVRVLKQAAPGPRGRYVPDVEKAGRLGLRVDTSLAEAIAATMRAQARDALLPPY